MSLYERQPEREKDTVGKLTAENAKAQSVNEGMVELRTIQSTKGKMWQVFRSVLAADGSHVMAETDLYVKQSSADGSYYVINSFGHTFDDTYRSAGIARNAIQKLIGGGE